MNEQAEKVFKEANLDLEADLHNHRFLQDEKWVEATLVKRQGIEKLIRHNHIKFKLTPHTMTMTLCVVHGEFIKGTRKVETLGSATLENTNQKPPYLPEMAEKRCKSRGVLMILDIYELGNVLGEDEIHEAKKASAADKLMKDNKKESSKNVIPPKESKTGNNTALKFGPTTSDPPTKKKTALDKLEDSPSESDYDELINEKQ